VLAKATPNHPREAASLQGINDHSQVLDVDVLLPIAEDIPDGLDLLGSLLVLPGAVPHLLHDLFILVPPDERLKAVSDLQGSLKVALDALTQKVQTLRIYQRLPSLLHDFLPSALLSALVVQPRQKVLLEVGSVGSVSLGGFIGRTQLLEAFLLLGLLEFGLLIEFAPSGQVHLAVIALGPPLLLKVVGLNDQFLQTRHLLLLLSLVQLLVCDEHLE